MTGAEARARSRLFPLMASLAAAGLLLLAAAGTLVGTQPVTVGDLLALRHGLDPSDDAQLLLVYTRLPRAALALLVGAALGAAGVLMQSLTRNPLAEPGLLGVNAGAAVAVALALTVVGAVGPSALSAAALLGAAAAGALVLVLGGARRGGDPIRLVLAGAALSVVLGSLTQIIVVNASDTEIDRYRSWMVGSLQGRGPELLPPALVLIGAGILLALLLSRALDAASLGHETARALGARPGRTWALGGLAIVLLAGGATAAAGPISFIGLTAPHLARWWVGSDHRRQFPAAMLIAAGLLLIADIAGRLVARPGEVGVGIMTVLIGGPFFVALVRGRRAVRL